MLEASVLFSGGSDSTLSAVRMLELCDRVHLLTFKPGFILFAENSRKHAEALKIHFGEGRVLHHIIDNSKLFRRMVLGNIAYDLFQYGPNLTVNLCQGCRLAMHARAIIFNLENRIPYLADGSIRRQVAEPTQLKPIIELNADFYRERYGVLYRSPVFEEDRSDLILDKMGISVKKRIKRQFIFFDTQATCPFGVPADVYGRVFYSRLLKSRQIPESLKYNIEKRTVLTEIIAESLGESLAEAVERLKSLHRIACERETHLTPSSTMTDAQL